MRLDPQIVLRKRRVARADRGIQMRKFEPVVGG